MAQDLEVMLSQMSDKFDESFADQQPSYKPNNQSSPSLNHQIKNHLQTQPQTPLKQQMIRVISQKDSEQKQLQLKDEEIPNQKLLQNQKAEIENPKKCQLQVTSSQEKLLQHIKAQQQRYGEEQNMQLQDKPINLEDQVQDELISYQSLTQKFQVALSRFKHTQSANQSQTQFAARQEHFLIKKATDLNLMRVEKQKQTAKLCPAKPLINSRSQKLLINHRPIHTRYQQILQQKKKKLQTQVAQKLARKAEEQEQQLQQIKEHQQQIRKKLRGQLRSSQEYYNQMKDWVQIRNKKVQDIAQKKKQQSKHQATFKPQINQKSQYLMKKNAARVPIYDKDPAPKKTAVDSNCTFKPNLNKTSKK